MAANVLFDPLNSGITNDDTELRGLPLPPSTLGRLEEAGYFNVADLDGVSVAELAEEVNMSPQEAARLMVIIRCHGEATLSDGNPTSALDLLKEERETAKLVTFVHELDELLGGGVHLKQLTEFAGMPGIGKTQLATQLALNVQIPRAFAGIGGEAVYIDTEGSFMADRAFAMASALIAHLRRKRPPKPRFPRVPSCPTRATTHAPTHPAGSWPSAIRTHCSGRRCPLLRLKGS